LKTLITFYELYKRHQLFNRHAWLPELRWQSHRARVNRKLWHWDTWFGSGHRQGLFGLLLACSLAIWVLYLALFHPYYLLHLFNDIGNDQLH
jgi:hypothetical protein